MQVLPLLMPCVGRCERLIGHSRPSAASAVWADQRKGHQIHSASDSSVLSVVPAGNGNRFTLRLQYLTLAKVVTNSSAINFFFGIFLLHSRLISSYRLFQKAGQVITSNSHSGHLGALVVGSPLYCHCDR